MPPTSFFFLFVSLFVGILLYSSFATSNSAAYAVNPTFNVTKGYQYIADQYNATHGLVRESETIETYWLWTDNVLASHVLKDYDYSKSANITATIRAYTSSYDLDYRHPQAVLFNSPAYFNGITNKQVSGNVWYSDSDGPVELECSNYGDIAFLKAIHYFKAGETTKAKTCYDMGASMFDGIGIRDSVFEPDGERYSTYKLALYVIASNVTGYEIPKEPLTIIPFMQNQTGGVYTHYRADLSPDSLTNVETTSLVLMAINGIHHQDPAVQQVTSNNENMMQWLLGLFAVIGFGVLLAKRRF